MRPLASLLSILLILSVGVGTATTSAAPVFRAEGRFLTGHAWVLPPTPDPCEEDALDGLAGSCIRLDADVSGRSWELRVEAAAVPPGSLAVCFFGEEGYSCTKGGRDVLRSMKPVPEGTTRAVVSASGGLDVAWSLHVF